MRAVVLHWSIIVLQENVIFGTFMKIFILDLLGLCSWNSQPLLISNFEILIAHNFKTFCNFPASTKKGLNLLVNLIVPDVRMTNQISFTNVLCASHTPKFIFWNCPNSSIFKITKDLFEASREWRTHQKWQHKVGFPMKKFLIVMRTSCTPKIWKQ